MSNDLSINIGVTSDELTPQLKKLQAEADAWGQRTKRAAQEASSGLRDTKIMTAQATREFIVLGHEVLTGRFSRIPGSMMVLAERAGQLDVIVRRLANAFLNPLTLGIVGVSAATIMLANHMSAIDVRTSNVENAFSAMGRSAFLSKDQIEAFIDNLSKLPDVSKADAETALKALAADVSMTHDQFKRVSDLLPHVAAGLGETVPNAAKFMAQALKDPQNELKKLQTEHNLLSAAQLREFYAAQAVGNQAAEQNIILDAMDGRYLKLTQHVGWFTKALNGLENTMGEVFSSKTPSGGYGDFWLTHGLSVPSAPKASPEAEKQVAQQQKLNDMKFHDNMLVQTGITLQQRINKELDKTTELQRQKASLEQSYFAAVKEGETAQAQSFLTTLNALNKKIADDKEKALHREQMATARAQAVELQGARTLASETYDLEAQKVQARAALGEISAAKELAMLRALAEKKYEIEKASMLKEQKLWDSSTAEYKRITVRLQQLQLQHEIKMDQIRQQSLRTAERQQQKYTQAIQQNLDRAFKGMLAGTMTWQQMMGGMFRGLLVASFDTATKKMLAQWQAGELQKTEATKVGNAARLTSDKTTAAASAGFNAKGIIAEIGGDAARAYSGVYGFLAPAMGPFAAIPAAGAFAAVAGMEAMVPSFDVGSWNVPQDTLAMVHANEMIVPKNFAQQMRQNGLNTGGGGGPVIHFNVSAIDGQSVAAFFKQNSKRIADSLALAHRNGHKIGGM